MRRIVPLAVGEFYHVVSKSIAGFKIFNSPQEYERFLLALQFYNASPSLKLSVFLRLSSGIQEQIKEETLLDKTNHLTQIIAYCLMPTHLHLLLRQVKKEGISGLMANLLNSYTRYFNLTHKRKGPLWESNFKNVLVDTDEQLLHLTRYIHLNPASAGLVDKPEQWDYSSYHEYRFPETKNRLCDFDQYIALDPKEYEKFVHDRIAYQRKLSKIKKLLLESYSG